MQVKILDINLPESTGIKVTGRQPTLECYLFQNVSANPNVRRPGGGYIEDYFDREAAPVAWQFLAQGYHAFICKYSVTPNIFPTQLLQLATSVKTIRDNADEWFVDPNKILLVGFSAGGHLICTLGCYWNTPLVTDALKVKPEEVKPNGIILGYPVISTDDKLKWFDFPPDIKPHVKLPFWTWVTPLTNDEPDLVEKVSVDKHVTSDFPPTFIFHTSLDMMANPENSIRLFMALIKNGVRAELHMFPTGMHGLSLGRADISPPDKAHVTTHSTQWVPLMLKWIEDLDEILAHDR